MPDPRRRQIEYAAMLDVETGEPVGRRLTGTLTRVDIRPHLNAMLRGRQYVQVHTHPKGSPHSPEDAVVLGRNPEITAMVVVGVGGYWYALSDGPGSAPRDDLRAGAVYGTRKSAFEALEEVYHAKQDAGDLTSQEAQCQHLHAVWERVASVHHVRYDRLMEGGGA